MPSYSWHKPLQNPLLTHEESETFQDASCCLLHPGTTGQALNWWELCFPACASQVHPVPSGRPAADTPHMHPATSPGMSVSLENGCPGGGRGGHMDTVRGGEVYFPGLGPVPMTQLLGCCPQGRGQEAQGPRELMLSRAEWPGTRAEHTHSALWLHHET